MVWTTFKGSGVWKGLSGEVEETYVIRRRAQTRGNDLGRLKSAKQVQRKSSITHSKPGMI